MSELPAIETPRQWLPVYWYHNDPNTGQPVFEDCDPTCRQVQVITRAAAIVWQLLQSDYGKEKLNSFAEQASPKNGPNFNAQDCVGEFLGDLSMLEAPFALDRELTASMTSTQTPDGTSHSFIRVSYNLLSSATEHTLVSLASDIIAHFSRLFWSAAYGSEYGVERGSSLNTIFFNGDIETIPRMYPGIKSTPRAFVRKAARSSFVNLPTREWIKSFLILGKFTEIYNSWLTPLLCMDIAN